MTEDEALEPVLQSCRSLLALKQYKNLLILKYEDSFTSDYLTIDKIASLFKVTLDRDLIDKIFSKFTVDAVESYIKSRESDGTFQGKKALSVWDPETLWHPSHLGDGRVGKWQEILSAEKAAYIYLSSLEFRQEYHYRDQQTVVAGESVAFNLKGKGVYFIEEGFSAPEQWGTWSITETARIQFRLSKSPTSLVSFSLTCFVGACYRTDQSASNVRIYINDVLSARLSSSLQNPNHILICMGANAENIMDNSVNIIFQFDNLLPADECGVVGDVRKLGLGLIEMRVDYETVEA